MAKTDLNLPEKRYMKTSAGWIKRTLAFLIDIFIIAMLTLPLQSAMPVQEDMTIMDTLNMMLYTPEIRDKVFLIELFSALIAMLYFIILEYKLRQTIGKTIIGLRVESEDKQMTLWQMFLRSMFLIPLIPFNLLTIIDPLFMIFRKDHKRLSDMISKTKVVEFVALN